MNYHNNESKHITLAIIALSIVVCILGFIYLNFGIEKTQLMSGTYRGQKIDTTLSPKRSIFNDFLNSTFSEKEDFDTAKALDALSRELASKDGTFSMSIKDYGTKTNYTYNETRQYYGASLYKLPIALAVLRELELGTLNLDTKVEYKEADYFGGSGQINQSKFGTEFTIKELLTMLLKHSDNTAQNMLVRTVGKAKVTAAIKYHFDTPSGLGFWSENMVTNAEFTTFLSNILERDFISEASKNLLVGTMIGTGFDDRIADHLDKDLLFAHKIGNWPESSSWHDCGFIIKNSQTIASVCLMSEGVKYEDFMSAGQSLAEIINHTF